MNLFETIYADDVPSLVCLVAIFYIVGANMADDTVRVWGWRAAAGGYVAFVIYACGSVNPRGASDLAGIAFRGLFAGGLTVGTTWMLLAIALFVIRELTNVEEMAAASPQAEVPQEVHRSENMQQGDEPPTDWKPNVREFSKLPPEAWCSFQDRRSRVDRIESVSRGLLEMLRKPQQSVAPPPSVSERARFKTQLDELELARQFIKLSNEDPQQLGQMLAECDAKIVTLRQALGRVPPAREPNGPPQLAGIAVFDEAIARCPDNAALHVERARYLVAERYFTKAIVDCNRALKLLPDYCAALTIRGIAYHHQRKYSAAVRDFERAIYDKPSYAWAYVSLAATYNAAKSYREALGPAYYGSLANAAGHHQLAIAYENLSEHEKAVHHLTAVIQSDPSGERVPNARVRRAKQLFQLGRLELAMHDLKTHLARKSDTAARQLLSELERLAAFNRKAADAEASQNGSDAEDPVNQWSADV